MNQATTATVQAREMGSRLGGYVQDWYGKLPFATGAIIAVCSVIEIINLITLHVIPGCLSGSALSFLRLYTLISHVFFHAGIIHLLLNILTFAPLAGVREKAMGTFSFLNLFFVLCIATSLVYLFLTFLVGFVFSSLWKVLFGVTIPGAVWPWLLLVVTQILFPSASFFGHLSGVLVGILYSQHVLDFALLPPSTMTKLEQSSFFAWAVSFPGFIQQPGAIVLPGSFPTGASAAIPTTSEGGESIFARVQRFFTSSRAGYDTIRGDDTESLLPSSS
ncbi:hypothetical protein HDU76_004684 [Blyttiomyces sp. JEL0837]|nr:hypothetical protein HDU76_004684 [Blyttiomyces sp. JEL0837]